MHHRKHAYRISYILDKIWGRSQIIHRKAVKTLNLFMPQIHSYQLRET